MAAISTSGHPALRRALSHRMSTCPLDSERCKWHVVGVRCAAPIGTNNKIRRAIWLRWLELGRGRSPGRHCGEVAARPAPQIEGAFGALRPSIRARARWIWDCTEQWLWAERTISNRRKPPSDSDRVTCHLVLWRTTHILRKIPRFPCRE